MLKHKRNRIQATLVALGTLLAVSCSSGNSSSVVGGPGFEVKLMIGSALEGFCEQAANRFNQQNPKLASGAAFHMTCEAVNSGDVVTQTVALAEQVKQGILPADAPEIPTLLSVDGEIYQEQLIYRMEQVYPGQNYIPAVTDSPLLANSPMVFMVPADLAPGLEQVNNLFAALVTAETHKDLDPSSRSQTIHYVHRAPTRSHSGLQTVVTQFASVSGKRPETLTVQDIQQYQDQVAKIQNKITRYGISTHSLANAMVDNGPFWASIGSVYESSVIEANRNLPAGTTPYVAIYPKATFTSNMRAILPSAPWVSNREKAATTQIIEYLQSPEAQTIANSFGLRPGTPGIALDPNFTAEFGVNPQATYDSYRPVKPEVVADILQS